MNLLQAILLGIIQGVTEFIPISSSAHLIVVPWLLGWDTPAMNSLAFDVSLHLGTLVAVVVYFWKDWVHLTEGLVTLVRERSAHHTGAHTAWIILIGTIPGAIAGVLAESKIEELFHQPGLPPTRTALLLLAAIVAIMGGLLLLADRTATHLRGLKQVTTRDAILVGIAQALAIFPGVSRSGSTITAGLALGFRRESAARFSFLLSPVLIVGAGLKNAIEIAQGLISGQTAAADLLLIPIGMLAAGISGYLCIRFLIEYLHKHSLAIFVYYRWVFAALIAVVALLR